MRVDALEIAQHVEMERARLYAFRSTFAQPRQMAVRTGEFRGSDFHTGSGRRCTSDLAQLVANCNRQSIMRSAPLA